MPKRKTIELPPVEALLSKEMTVNLSEHDYRRIKALSVERGEKGPSVVVRKLVLAALEELGR